MATSLQLKRLAILVAGVGTLVFGCLGGYAKYEARSAQAGAEIQRQNWIEANIECEKNKAPFYCESIDLSKREFDEAVAFRDERDEDAISYFVCSVAMPLLCAVLWFGGAWIVTGSVGSGVKP